MEKESRFYESLKDGVVRCTICPRMCIVPLGKRGFCEVKENKGGSLLSLTYGELSALAVDPIEKKPLAHFHPGSLALSVSSVGCSFTCPWCQNWHLSASKAGDLDTRYASPIEVVTMASRQDCTSIAYTYNEPLINLDYFEDVARLAKEKGIKNVLVTNGYISQEALSKVVDIIDAANVDWKAFNDSFYKKHCSADLHSVLDATVEMKRQGVHIEITFLIIPDTNDSENEIRGMSQYILEELGLNTPLHLSRFFPHYKFRHIPQTPVDTLYRAREIAIEEGIRYVYVGNVPLSDYNDTYCHHCGEKVVERSGYAITLWRLDHENRCAHCGGRVPIVGNRENHRRGLF
jgi:pyruvate formate lyase activating enzyme